jgi:hypothetical protein
MTTKTLLAAALLLAAPLSASADVTGFGGPVIGVTQAAGETAVLFGGRGGALFNGKFLMGGAGFGLGNTDLEVDAGGGFRPNLRFAYGGAWLGYWVQRPGSVEFLIHTIVGGGSAGLESEDERFEESDSVVVVEPGVDVVWKASDSVRVHVGASWRFVSGIEDVPGLEDGDVDGPSAFIGVSFGGF